MQKTLLFFAVLFVHTSVQLHAQCPAFDAGPDKCILSGQGTTIGPFGQEGGIFSWSPATGLNAGYNLPNPFASPTSTTNYTLTYTAHDEINLLTNGDLSQGYTGFSSGYTAGTPATPGHYMITNNTANFNTTYCNPTTSGWGNMLVVDGSTSGASATIWSQTVAVTPNSKYYFRVNTAAASSLSPAATVGVKINGTVVLAPQPFIIANSCLWYTISTQWNSGTAATATISLYSSSTSSTGNDMLFDNFVLYKYCAPQTDQVTVTVSNINYYTLISGFQYQEGMAPATSLTNLTGDNAMCFGWESGVNAMVYGYATNGLNWIVNDVPIPASGYYTGVGSIALNGSELKHFNAQENLSNKYQLAATGNGCTYTTPAMIVRPVQTYYDGTGYVTGNYLDQFTSRTVNRTIAPRFTYGTPTTYTWTFPPEVAVSDVDITTPEIFVSTISPNYAPPFLPSCNCYYIPVQLTIANNPTGCNGTFNLHIDIPATGFRIAQTPAATNGNIPGEAAISDIKLYPNPVRDLVILQVPAAVKPVSAAIYAINGQLLKTFKGLPLSSSTLRLPVQELPSGNYILSVTTSGEPIKKKFSVYR